MKCVCKKVSVCLKCVFASRIDFSLNLVPLYTTVSKNSLSVRCLGLEFGLFIEDFDVWFTYVP